MPVVPVGISLGSNLGDRNAELQGAIGFLRTVAIDGRVMESPRFETTPVDCPPGSPTFLNSVAEIKLDSIEMTPLNLLRNLQEYEMERGRAPFHEINSPRPIDLDILYYGASEYDALDLIIPHPRAHLRRFVLQPLAFLRPELILPGQKRTVRELWDDMRKRELPRPTAGPK
jgi:2-amino-4-hydroxy-6-hydroxymethyldihydropteridine diphosphokinase